MYFERPAEFADITTAFLAEHAAGRQNGASQ
jgi:hypothetical protein